MGRKKGSKNTVKAETEAPKGWDQVEGGTENPTPTPETAPVQPETPPQAEAPVTESKPTVAKPSAEDKALAASRKAMEKYPHVDPSTVRRDTATGKMRVMATCVVSGVKFEIFTSDAFQVKMTPEAAKKAKADKKAKDKADIEIGLKLLAEKRATTNS